MLLFPIGTDRPQRRFPWANVVIIALNIVIYLLTHPFGPVDPAMLSKYTGMPLADERFLLNPMNPHLYQFITYQFLHQGLSHIGFNMLFLYVFGNNLNEKLGNIGYAAFYLTGGVLAGCGQMLTSTNPTLGASGAISAVAGLFLILLPRTHIRIFVSIFFLYVDVWEIPSMYFILFKIGEDVFEQAVGGSGVAYMAHITGTVAGIAIGMLLLLGKLVQRDHYDMLAMLNRYRRKKAYEAVVASGYDPFTPSIAKGPPAGIFNRGKAAELPAADPRIESLRTEINRLLRLHELPDAVQRYLELRSIDPSQVLASQDQVDVANQLMSTGRYQEAASAYEDFLRVYPRAPEFEQIMLILGLIYARYYPRAERARELLQGVLPRLHDMRQKELAEAELQKLAPGGGAGGAPAEGGNGGPATPPAPI